MESAVKKVLVVEDTKSIREILCFMLKNRGYAVVETGDGGAVADLVKNEVPDLILLDAMLPNRSGFEICSDLKSHPRYAQIKIIMLTAITKGTGKTDEHWKQKSGADDFFSKPFRAQDLVNRIVELIGPSGAAPAGAAPKPTSPPPPPAPGA